MSIDHEENSNLIAWYWLLGVGLIVATSFGVAILRPTWLSMERDAYVESHQYVESQMTQLLTNIEKYDELEAEILKYEKSGDHKIVAGLRMQQRSLKKRIRASLGKIPPDQHPSDTNRFQR